MDLGAQFVHSMQELVAVEMTDVTLNDVDTCSK